MAICRGIKHSPQADRMPNEDKGEDIFQFKNWKHRMQVPYYFVADFEAILKPIESKDATKKTKKIQEHKPCSFSYVKVRYDGHSYPEKIYLGLNAAQRFILDIIREAMEIREEYKDPKPMLPLSPQEIEAHDNATHCWICEGTFDRPEGKARDHCHITGKYRGAAHHFCNLQLQIKPGKMHIPIIFHNLSGYDSHIIMQGIGAMECNDEIEPIPYNMEKYMAFKLGSL